MISIDANIVKNTAGVPRAFREAEYPLDKNTLASIIQSCKDRRLKALLFLFYLAQVLELVKQQIFVGVTSLLINHHVK